MVRFLPSLAVLVIAVVVTWNLARRTASEPEAESSPTPARTATAASTPRQTRAAAETPTAGPGYRLAGTVVGDVRYAIIEAPDGSNELYSIGQTIPGIGKLVEVGAASATIDGDDGRFIMKLLAASTPTPAPPPSDQERGDDFEGFDDDSFYEEGDSEGDGAPYGDEEYSGTDDR